MHAVANCYTPTIIPVSYTHLVPGWVGDPRQDLLERLNSGKKFDTPLEVPEITHWLHNICLLYTSSKVRVSNRSRYPGSPHGKRWMPAVGLNRSAAKRKH